MNALKKWAPRVVVVLVLVVAIGLVSVKVRYGGGDPYPDLSTAPLLETERVSVLAELELPAGNIAVSAEGRVFFDLHPFANPERFSDALVFELKDGRPVAYPDLASQQDFVGALGMTVDAQNRLWIVRPAGLEDRKTRLFAYDLATNARVVDVALHDDVGPFAQDLRVSPDGRHVVLADTGIFEFTPPALVVFDVETQRARRVLEGHPALSPQPWKMQLSPTAREAGEDTPQEQSHESSAGYSVLFGLVTFKVGVDGIAFSPDGSALYIATMSHDSVFKIATNALFDPDAKLEGALSFVAKKPLSDGIAMGTDGTLYITDVEHGGVAALKDGQLKTLFRHPDILWADGVAVREGRLYLSDSRIPAYIDQMLGQPKRARVDAAGPHRLYVIDL